MIVDVELALRPEQAAKEEEINALAIKKAKVDANEVKEVQVLKRSIDARGRQPLFRLKCRLYIQESRPLETPILSLFNKVDKRSEVVIIGAGPAGYFAALELIEQGCKPIIFERGKNVRERRRDLRAIMQFDTVNPDSNYCFGEGGAGTYSDGKLYTRSVKRGNHLKVMKLLVEHGAQSDILIDAHPHIGSNKLPKIVSAIRETIEHYGGQVHFGSKVTDIHISEGKVTSITLNHEENYPTQSVILATGHSARDIFYLLEEKNVTIEAKPFALGIRAEHPQSLIDSIQYRQSPRGLYLPASSYRLACQVKGEGVFSFCMCPGGLVVPAATAPGEIVVNGMSMSRRDSKFANSGIVVSVDPAKLKRYQQHGVFASLRFQQDVEQKMFNFGTGSQQAPALRLTDFVNNKLSASLNDNSYIPGLYPAPLYELLPGFIAKRLQAAFRIFGQKMKGYYTEEANVIGVESRTSSPVRIPREKETLMHPDIEGLFPCGEGAGYAGGILSAAMDGQNVAKAVANFMQTVH